jgi:hypothetical protein
MLKEYPVCSVIVVFALVLSRGIASVTFPFTFSWAWLIKLCGRVLWWRRRKIDPWIMTDLHVSNSRDYQKMVFGIPYVRASHQRLNGLCSYSMFESISVRGRLSVNVYHIASKVRALQRTAPPTYSKLPYSRKGLNSRNLWSLSS